MKPIASPYPVSLDLYSDTRTVPTAGMRRAMYDAPVGDEQAGEDPSTNELLTLVADLLGHEEAVLLPSGTMCNEIAFAVHCRPGDEMFLDENAHPLTSEGGGPAALAGAMVHPIRGTNGIFDATQLEDAVRPQNRYSPRARLVSVEQTAGRAGGTCWSLSDIEQVARQARDLGLRMHMDGARLLNAVVATGISAREFCAPFDSVWIDLSKGLGCPVGGVLAGDAAFIDDAWRIKQRIGGSMRQSGIIAAAGVYALRNHVDRLADDHGNARLFAESIAQHPHVRVDLECVQTNIVMFDLVDTELTAFELAEQLVRNAGIRISTVHAKRNRVVTHLGIDSDQIVGAVEAIGRELDRR